MYIDDHVVLKYLNDEEISEEWIFDHLLPGEHLFAEPERSKEEIRFLNEFVKEKISHFSPYHQRFFDHIFPEWRNVYEHEMKVMLVVGCPYPYDAMTRVKEEEQIIIFDLNRIYSEDPESVTETVRRLITHEFFHVLYESDRRQKTKSYREELLDLVFNEGFAHYLSMEDVIRSKYESFKKEHYDRNLAKLQVALDEQDVHAQKRYLIEANTGNFFDKFASVVGMFILMDHEEIVEEIYQQGAKQILCYA